MGKLQLARGEVDRVGEHVEAEGRAHVVHVEPEPVRHHGELGACCTQTVDERLEPGVERHLRGDRAQSGFVAVDQRPLVDDALAAPDLAPFELVVEVPPFRGPGAAEHVHADVDGADGAVEVEEHRCAREIEIEPRHRPKLVVIHTPTDGE